MEKINLNCSKKINIGKKYIKTLEDFEKNLIDDKHELDADVERLSIIKNYLIDHELSKILNKYLINFQHLQSLNLTANDLSSIPTEINILKNLQILILNNNKIQEIENLEFLSNIKRLELRSNRIREFNNLKTLENLQLLTLSCNLMKEIKEESMGYYENLEELGLFGNYLGDENGTEEKNLKILEEFAEILSKHTPNIKSLYIGGNYFTKFKDSKNFVKSKFPNLKYLDGKFN